MANIKETKSSLIFENAFAEITISKKDAIVEKILDKKSKKEITGEKTYFFSLLTGTFTENEEVISTSLALSNDTITVQTPIGGFDVKCEIKENYFTFELTSALPEKSYKALLAHARYDYDFKDKANTGAVGIALTYWADPCFYPDAKSLETKAEVTKTLKDNGAKYALIIAPINEQKDIIKEACLTIDKNTGIMSEIGGAWGRDSRLNFGNYSLQYSTERNYIKSNVDTFKEMSIDQLDFHQGSDTFRQGDFYHYHYENHAEFKKYVSDVLEDNGMSAGLHTYSFYLAYSCSPYLSNPKWQKQLGCIGEYTIAEDIGEEDKFIRIEEDTSVIPADRGFNARNSPFILVGEEIMYFVITEKGLQIDARGFAGTKKVPHKKGEKIRHIDGKYAGIAPIPGSELFLEIAKETAKAYNEGGFKMIYLDALDGVRAHIGKGEQWYYYAMFVCEILKYCDTYPLIEFSDFTPSLWAARGRIGAYDFPTRNYKNFNRFHSNDNEKYIDRYSAPTLGWYDFYPQQSEYPGNYTCRYQHTDDIDFMGTLAVAFDYSNVSNGTGCSALAQCKALRRNMSLYKKYDDLRKAEYFSEGLREKLANGKYEYQLKEKRGKRYVFVEKNYQPKRLFDLSDPNRNTSEFKNPFGPQIPYIRIEASLSSAGQGPQVLFPLDEKKDLISQNLKCMFGTEINAKDRLALKVRVLGNGKKGGTVAISFHSWSVSDPGRIMYYIDTDFTGWREFILVEAHNGERLDLPLHQPVEKETDIFWQVHRAAHNADRLKGVEIETVGDMTGVRMSSITVCEHTYEILKNPTVKIGDGSLMFECELMSSDFIEFDGENAKVVDRFGNEKPIWFKAESFKAPRGKFKASLEARALNRTIPQAKLTFGFTGKEVK
ncbi:MAG: hypothetical protein IJ323_07095 [Clostridia bacterium]|nr:hypothetical protein [Clostridia bacterium]